MNLGIGPAASSVPKVQVLNLMRSSRLEPCLTSPEACPRSRKFIKLSSSRCNVAVNAGVYLPANPGMIVVREMDTDGLFDVDQWEVADSLLRSPRRP